MPPQDAAGRNLPLNGTGIATIALSAEMNPTSSIRTAKVLISAAGLVPQAVVVSQELGTTAVSNLQASFIKVYPNPTKEVLYVEGFSASAMLSLFDATGKLLLTQKLSSKQINIGHLVGAIYLIRVTDKIGVVTKQFVKSN